jgi:hypothetical protein
MLNRHKADRQGAAEAARGREQGEAEGAGGHHRADPQRRLGRQFEVDRDAEPHRHRQPEHPAAALGIELIQDPGTRPRHAVRHLRLFDSAGTLAYLRRAFPAEMRQNPRAP